MRIKLTGFSGIAVLVFFIFALSVFCIGCKEKAGEESKTEPSQGKVDVPPKSLDAGEPRDRQSDEQNKDERPAQQSSYAKSPAEYKVEPAQKDTAVAASSKLSLMEIIRNRRSWNPIFTSWYGLDAPDFTLTDIDGKQHKLRDYRGKDVLIIFWATWCGPCHVEIPHLIELRNTVGEDKLAMLAISNERADMVKRFVADKKLNYTVFSHDSRAMSAPYNQVAGIPSSIFITPDSKLKLATEGVVSVGEIKAILQAE